MFIVGLLTWWYGAGWRLRFAAVGDRLAGMLDYFSLDLLLRTLFAPFRQISAGRVEGPLGVKMRAFFDRLISRVIGAVVRMTMILVGSLMIIVYALTGGIMAVFWVTVPLLPIVGIVMAVSGWMPWIQ